MSRRAAAIAFVMIGLCVLMGFAAERTGAHTNRTAVMWSAAEIKWTDNPAIKGAKVAVLWGDPKTGAYGAFKTIPAGGSIPLHTHTHDARVALVAGTVALSMAGEPAKELGPGSYAFIPGGVEHAADCMAGADCVYLEQQTGASDIKFVEKTAWMISSGA